MKNIDNDLVLMGDFNAKVGSSTDLIVNDDALGFEYARPVFGPRPSSFNSCKQVVCHFGW